MNSLDSVIKRLISIIKQYEKLDKSGIEASYYRTILKYIKLEHKYPKQVESCGKPIYHYFKYHLPVFGTGYFEYLYNPYNPVRNAVETFDSIDEIRNELIIGNK